MHDNDFVEVATEQSMDHNQQQQQPNSVLPRRACEECNRKKTRCDMIRPICGLCQRLGSTCVFPSRRKSSQSSKAAGNRGASRKDISLDRLVTLLEGRLRRENNHYDSQSPSTQEPQSAKSNEITSSLLKTTVEDLFITGDSTFSPCPTTPGDEDFEGRVANVAQPSITSNSSLDPKPTVTSAETRFSVDLLPDVVENLIEIYFAKIQAWLPLFHRPRFYQEHMIDPIMGTIRPLQDLSLSEALIFNSMFALAARHSTSSFFAGIPCQERGNRFAREATLLCELSRIVPEEHERTSYLQGCTLLAFYHYANGSCSHGWMLTGKCVRLAYEMELDKIDEDGGLNLEKRDWVSREGLRRIWWLVWELDLFASTVSNRPYAIDRRRMSVMLPASDAHWFSEIPIASAELDPRPEKTWKTLQDCPNQDERAWFLVGNFLMAIAHDMSQWRNRVSMEEKLVLQTAINWFELVLPKSFHFENGAPLTFNAENFSRSNWIVSTRLLSTSAKIVAANLSTEPACASQCARDTPMTNDAGFLHMLNFTMDVSRILAQWSTDYVPASHPFIACALVGPAAVHIKNNIDIVQNTTLNLGHERTKEVLLYFAKYWKVGSIMLRLIETLESGASLTSKNLDIARRFPVLFASSVGDQTSNSNTIDTPSPSKLGHTHPQANSQPQPFFQHQSFEVPCAGAEDGLYPSPTSVEVAGGPTLSTTARHYEEGLDTTFGGDDSDWDRILGLGFFKV